MAEKVGITLNCLFAITAKWVITKSQQTQMSLYLCVTSQNACNWSEHLSS